MAKVLFQAMGPHVFRSTFIGYLHEIAQKHEVVLLSEDLDSYTKKLLDDKNIFPGLEKVIFFQAAFGGNIVRKNYRLYKKLKKTVQDFKPDIVVAHSDIWPPDVYLLRLAKKAGAVTVAIQASFKIAEQKKLYLWSCLVNSYLKMPMFLPFFVRFFLVKVKKYIVYVLYYWILPLTVGELPFRKTSFLSWGDSSGQGDADYAVVFSKRDYDISIKDGVKPEKLLIISHPLEHEATKRFFEETYFSQYSETEHEKTATIMWSDERIGFDANNYTIVPKKKIRESKIAIVKHMADILADWQIFIKPHPSMGDVSVVQEFLGEIPQNVSIVNPKEPAGKYIEMSNVIVGLPLPSTTLFSAQKQHAHKIILSLNINNEFVGDSYVDFDGIEYIDSEEKLIHVLHAIQNNTYEKKESAVSQSDFADAEKLIQHLVT